VINSKLDTRLRRISLSVSFLRLAGSLRIQVFARRLQCQPKQRAGIPCGTLVALQTLWHFSGAGILVPWQQQPEQALGYCSPPSI
jgi:hypothetical protein